MRKRSNSEDQLSNALEHAMAMAMGKPPRKPLAIVGPMRPQRLMIERLSHLHRLGPVRDFVLSNGVWFELRANVKDYPIAIKWRNKMRPEWGNCFLNSREFCLAHSCVRYFEGFYLIAETPERHAWIVLENGMVLDFTLEAAIRKFKIERAKYNATPPLYFGVEVPLDRLDELHNAVEPNMPILELYAKILQGTLFS